MIDFARPPVTEVAISTSFRPIATPLLWAGRFRDAVRDSFPRYEEQPPYRAPVEQFDAPFVPEFTFTAGPPPVPRLWLLSEDGDELLQLQRDWFACNWRKVAPSAEYGRWDSRWAAFEQWFKLFEETTAAESGGIDHIQCEVTYVNHIESNGEWQHHGQLSQVLTIAGVPRDTQLPDDEQILVEAEGVAVSARYLIRDDEGAAIGRLHISTGEAFRMEDHKPVIQLTLTARGRPEGKDFDGVRRFAERAHSWIVAGFCAITTDRMQTTWGRIAHD